MKFTVITKDGSKWLRPTGVLSGVFDVIYIGTHPEETILDGSEVREVRQYWIDKEWRESPTSCDSFGDFETRTAYTDAEPDIDYEKEMPYKEWPSTKYVARPADAESHTLPAFDEILNNTSEDAKMNVSLQMDLNYWKRRCEAAERYINESPCDPDITPAQEAAYDAWQQIVEQEPK